MENIYVNRLSVTALPRSELLRKHNSSYTTVLTGSDSSGGGTSGGGKWDNYFSYDEVTKVFSVVQPADGESEISFVNTGGDIVAYADLLTSVPNFWDGLPVASSTVLGGIKVGTNLSILNGVLSADGGAPQTLLFSNPNLSISDGNTVDLSDLTPDLTDYYTKSETNTWRNSTTQTEMGYVHGVTSDIQNQINAKVSSQWVTVGSNIYYNTGNVGIGTTSPDDNLNIESNTGGVLRLGSSDTTMAAGEIAGGINFYKADTSVGGAGVPSYIRCVANDAGGTFDLLLHTGDTGGSYNGDLILKYNGNVGIGTTSPKTRLHIHSTIPTIRLSNTTVNSANSGTIEFGEEHDSANDPRFKIHYDGATNKFHIVSGNPATAARLTILRDNGNIGIGTTAPTQKLHVAGNIIATGEVTAYSSSDINLKTKINPLLNGLEIVNKLNPKTFNWNDKALELASYKNKEQVEAGLIAQEVEEVIPSIVGDVFDQYKGIKYEMLTPYLISAIQELSERVKYLEHALNDYEN